MRLCPRESLIGGDMSKRFVADSPVAETSFELVWDFSCQVVAFGLLPVLCSEREGGSSSRRLRSGSRREDEQEMGPFFEAQASDGANVCVIIRGELAIGHGSRTAHLYTVGSFDPDHDAIMRIGGEAPGGGPILSVGISAMFEYGFPPPRIVTSAVG